MTISAQPLRLIPCDGTEDLKPPVLRAFPDRKGSHQEEPLAGGVCDREPHRRSWNPLFRLIDVGFSGTEGLVLAEHPSRAEWDAENDGVLQVYLLDLKRHEGDPATRAQAIIEEYATAIGRRKDHFACGLIAWAGKVN